ncbi:entericidin A/B family lipoprotein [Kosakonia sp.]|nr:entericidin A/B family lipoprotein [Kosakonia sp.]
MKRFAKFLSLMLISCAFLSGCNTARGVGEDIQSLGHVISRAAN